MDLWLQKAKFDIKLANAVSFLTVSLPRQINQPIHNRSSNNSAAFATLNPNVGN
jgi:hypothetical protein